MTTFEMPTRRLPFAAVPHVGESFPSWIDRTAAALGVPPGTLADALGLPLRRHHTNAVPVLLGAVLTPTARQSVMVATGLPGAAVDAMQLTAYDGTALQLDGLNPDDERTLQSVGRREWVQVHTSRACPQCLAETSGVWLLAWKLSMTAVCVRHRRLLLDACPSCGSPLRGGWRGGPRALSRVRRAEPLRCGATRRGFRCTARLDTVAPGAAVPPWLSNLQRTVLRAADGATLRVGGRAVAPQTFFTGLRSLAAVVRFAAWPESLHAALPPAVHDGYAAYLAADRSRGGGADGYRARPADAATAAGLLAAIAPVLNARTRSQLHTALQAIAAAAGTRRRELGRDPLSTLPLPAVVRSALIPPLPHARVARGAMQVASAGDVPRLAPGAIPELIAGDAYAELVSALLPGTFELTGRRFAALAVARLAGARSWTEAAAMTGCPPERARRLADVIPRRVQDPAALWRAAHVLAARLQHDGIDYAGRRAALAQLTRVPAHVLPAPARRAGAPWTQQRSRHAATWVWSELTGGDWRDAPAQHDPAWSATSESRREGFRRFRAAAAADLLAALRDYGLELYKEAT